MEFFKPPGALLLKGNLSENWRRFEQSFDIYLNASALSTKDDARKIAILLNTAGEEAIEIYNNFVWTTAAEKLKFSSVLEQFKKYCNPRKNIRYNRYLFYKRSQDDGELFDHYLAEIQKLVKNCEFKDEEDMLLDRIILGINDLELQARLIKLDDPKLVLSTCVEYCRVSEVTKFQLSKVQHGDASINEVSRDQKYVPSSSNVKTVQNHYFNSSNQSNLNYSRKNFKCKNCTYNHEYGKCPAWGKICHICKEKNHFAPVCSQRNKQLHVVSFPNENNNEEENFYVNILAEKKLNYGVTNNNNENSNWLQKIKIDNYLIDFKLDTGADVNVIPLSIFNLIRRYKNYKLKPMSIQLEAYGGFQIKPIGCIEFLCESKHGFSLENFYVVDINSKPVLSGKSCVKMGFIKRINSIDESKVNFIQNNKSIFEGTGKFPEKCKILIKSNAIPSSKPPNRIPIKLVEKVKIKLLEMEKNNIICKINEPSEWVSKLVIVEKPNKDLRLCLDPQEVNKSIVKDYFVIPTLDDLTSKLAGREFFTVLDLKEGFWQVELDDQSSKICSFSTPFGCYRFLRLPYGINVSAEVFQKLNTKYFGDIEGVHIYIDDILIAGKTLDEHDQILEKVIKRAKEINVKFNSEKLQYRVNSVKYIGHIFSKLGVSVDDSRINAIINYEIPKNKKDLQRYLGMINYLRNFIPNLSEISTPLRELLKKNNEWCWLAIHNESIKKLNKAITNTPVLKNFDETKSIVIQTDASKSALGSCLLQQNPVCFASKSLTTTECMYSQIEKEFLSILFSCKKFHSYIYGRKVKVFTDHKPLVSIMKKQISDIHSSRLQRIKLKLMKYDLEVVHCPGKDMHIADALSRACDNIEIEQNTDSSLNEIIHSLDISDNRQVEFEKETENDVVLRELKNVCKIGWPKNKSKVNEIIKFYWSKQNNILLENNLLFFDNRIMVPSSMRIKMLNLIHESHFGINKTVKRAKSLLYWPNMAQDIENVIVRCKICEKFQANNAKEKLISHEIPDLPFQKVGTDILEFAGYNYLVVVDYFSNYIDLVKLRSKQAVEIIYRLKNIFAVHGIPELLISDNMPFDSYEFREFCKAWNFQLITSSPYYAKSNGLSEKAVGICKNILKKSKESNTDWQIALLEYRNSPLSGLNISPAQMLFNRTCRSKIPISRELLKPKIFDNIKSLLIENDRKSKINYDKTAKDRNYEFQAGDKVVFRKGKYWEPAVIINKGTTPRSYIIKDENNRIKRRNKFHLRKSHNTPKFRELGREPFINPYLRGFNYQSDHNQIQPSANIDNQLRNNIVVEDKILTADDLPRSRYGRIIRKPDRLGHN